MNQFEKIYISLRTFKILLATIVQVKIFKNNNFVVFI